MKKQIGHVEIKLGDIEPVYFSEDKGFDRDTEWLKDWALLLNSPWSANSTSYFIKPYFNNTDITEPCFFCQCTVMGCDVKASIIGYGKTPEEALKNCMIEHDKIQKEFNPDDEWV